MKTVMVCNHDEMGACGGECHRCRLEALQKRLDAVLEAVGEMRHAQMEFFRTQSQTALEEARRCERRVDKLLGELTRPTLF